MPDELASDAGAFGSIPRSRWNSASCASLAGWSGSSAQARWLITSPIAMPSKAPGVAASRSTSAGGMPMRDMPLSTCSVAGSRRPARFAAARHASICSRLLSTGMAPAAMHSSSAPGGCR